MGKPLAFLYGIVVYGLFLVTFLYAIGFVGNLYVPKSIDSGGGALSLESVVVDAVLLGIFAIQHSVMARQWFKRGWTRIIPRPIERTTYVLLATAALALIIWQWRPMTEVVWDVESGAGRTILFLLFWVGWLTVLACTFLIDHFDLFGLKQVTNYLLGRPYEPPHFVMRREIPGPTPFPRRRKNRRPRLRISPRRSRACPIIPLAWTSPW
jgi:protein-S-isoprenylcysteine O-methyltransferase Ste14